MVRLRTACLLGLACAGVLALAEPAGADTVISADASAENVSAYGGALVWSRRDGASYRLVQRVGGITTDAPLAPSPAPFDADLGPGRRGGLVAVYSRCADPATRRRCDVYRHVLGTTTERKARGASIRRCSETAPSTWAGAVAFARTGPRCRRGLYLKEPGSRPARRRDRVLPVETEIRRSTIVALCRTTRIGDGDDTRNCIRYRSARLGPYTVDSATLNSSGEGGLDLSPSIDGGFVYWAAGDNLGGGANVLRSALRSPFAPFFASRYWTAGLDSVSVDAGALFYAGGGVFVADDPRPSFTPPS